MTTITTDTQKIDYRSDFDFVAQLSAMNADGSMSVLGFPTYDWDIILRRTSQAPYIVSSRAGSLTNCINDNGQIRVVCKDHNFVPGQLKAVMRSYIPNPIYPDGIQVVVSTHILGIELVDGVEGNNMNLVATLQLPIVVMGGDGVENGLYLSKIEASALYQPKGDYATKEELPKDIVTSKDLACYQPIGDYATTSEMNGKQDALIAGDGIDITNSVIKCTLDTSLYKVVVGLPEIGEENKLYLIQSKDRGVQNIYDEYGYINGQWEMLGQYRAEINLEPYALKTDIATKVSELENDKEFVTFQELVEVASQLSDDLNAVIPTPETYVLNFNVQDGVNEGSYSKEEYDKLRAAIQAGKLIIIGGTVTRVTADSQAMAADYVVIRYSTPRISDDSKSVTVSFYELKFGILITGSTEYRYSSKAIHKTMS